MQLMIKTLTGRKQSFNFDEDNTVRTPPHHFPQHLHVDFAGQASFAGKRRNYD